MKAFLTIGIVAVLLSYPVKANASLPEPIVKPGEIATQPGDLPAPEGLELDEDSYPVTDGSTSAEPLGVWVASRLLGLHPAWLTLPLENERRLWPVENGEREDERDNVTLIRSTLSLYGQKLRHRGTHTAYRRLIEGQADLIYECRPPSPDEVKLMEEHGVELDVTPIALDAFVFLRHRDNPVNDLTSDQVRDIYTRAEDGERGRIDNWEQVDGPDTAINAYTRNPNSGSQETLLTLVMKDREVITGRGMVETFAMVGPYNRLYDDPQGIGFTFYYYQVYMAPQTTIDPRAPGDTEPDNDDSEPESPVEMFAIDGVMPSPETIADGSYPWLTKVYVVTRKDLDPEHPAARLRDWLLTEEGQSVIAETGYVPLRDAPWGISERIRLLAGEGQFHAAMRLLPDAMNRWNEYIERTGETHEGAHGFVHAHFMSRLVHEGDAHWGAILDDPHIPYVYKTEMIFEILEARLGKGSVYFGNEDNLIVPRHRRNNLREERIRLPETGENSP